MKSGRHASSNRLHEVTPSLTEDEIEYLGLVKESKDDDRISPSRL